MTDPIEQQLRKTMLGQLATILLPHIDTYAARRADEARQTELYAVNKVNNAIYSDDPAAYYVNIQRHVNNRLAELSHKEAKG